MRKIIGLCVTLGSVLLGACTTLGSENRPAVLVNPTPQTLDELTNAVSKALNGAKVTLAPKVFTSTNTLIIDRSPQRSIQNGTIMGRMMGKPDHFTLQKSGKKCLLIHEETGQAFVLKTVKCREFR